MLAWHLGWRYLCKRRAAWLAFFAITLTVAVPVVVIGVIQGFLDVTTRQARANESDLTATSPWFGDGITDTAQGRATISTVPGVARIAPFVSQYGLLVPRLARNDSEQGVPAFIEGIDWEADTAIGRLAPGMLHPPPVENLSAPVLAPGERGTGFLTPTWRAHLALSGLDMAAALGCGPLPLAPRQRPPIGVVTGREVLYSSGIRIGVMVDLIGGKGKKISAEISDTIGTGILEIDRFAVLIPLGHGQSLAGYESKASKAGQVGGWRIQGVPDSNLKTLSDALQDATGLRVDTWLERRGNMVKSMELQRNIMALVMVAIQTIAVFIVYAVFSTLVAEKRHDIGVLLGLGARRRDIAGAFLLAGLAACVLGGASGWLLGWGVLAGLNPLSKALNMPLFPQDVIYTPEAPTSFDPLIPLFFMGVMSVVGVIAVALPAWRAARIVPVDILRESA
jgi:ABC-type lipoprotein release transport system permease subunit